MRKVLLLLLFTSFLVGSEHSYSQDINDAVRNATRFYTGTARFNAMGGAMGAMGADPSLTNTNPAGLGLFRRNEFSISPSLNWRQSETEYNGTQSNDINQRIELNNLSFVFHNETGNRTGLIQYAWGLGFSRSASYHQNYKVGSQNPGTSVLDEFTFDLNNPTPIDPSEINLEPSLAYGAALAWNTFLTDYDTAFGDYFHANSFYEGNQQQQVEIEGSTTHYQLSAGGNFNNTFYLGASLDLSLYRYQRLSIYSEDIMNGEFTELEDFTFREELNINGLSTRFRLGGIYQATRFLRVGLAYHFGYTTNMNDEFNSIIRSRFSNGNRYESQSPDGSFSYSVRAPGRLIVSTAFLLKKRGAIGIEYEVVDYSKSRFSNAENGYDYEFENDQISNQLRTAHAVRLGGEFRRGTLTFRGGMRYEMSPFKNEELLDHTLTYSTGIGFRNQKAFFDLAYLYQVQNSTIFMYDAAFATTVDSQLRWHSLVITAGLRWN